MKKVAILRGINVSGHKKIKMEDLKKMFEDSGCTDVTTYIQSGNVIFNSEIDNNSELKQILEKAIKDTFGFDVPVIIRSHEDLQNILNNTPCGSINLEADGAKYLLTMLAEAPDTDKVETLMSYVKEPEQLVVKEENIYLYCPNGYGETKLSNVFIEKKLGVQATTRNWKTITKLHDMCEG
ncbi:MAG TPA: DUF1697 domain-containing protein [Gammaproteobacteria bacterium]|jgi:uncharacterized protein (DUF1697 family)|nr:DUF1697 domain-containing protein [Xanthomonadales bacterium]MCB1595750.1 DUF1697 domain-containing protein [Xanthomonadales bacterium]MCB1604554.1 DUF1697 domain-containing protein [Xanthomonadales bacterium]HPI96996.1 DUF1697 domain-containing protein [Gammaproteobacteria bacterium]